MSIYKQHAMLLVSLAVALGILGFVAYPSQSSVLLWVLALMFIMLAVIATLMGWIKQSRLGPDEYEKPEE